MYIIMAVEKMTVLHKVCLVILLFPIGGANGAELPDYSGMDYEGIDPSKWIPLQDFYTPPVPKRRVGLSFLPSQQAFLKFSSQDLIEQAYDNDDAYDVLLKKIYYGLVPSHYMKRIDTKKLMCLSPQLDFKTLSKEEFYLIMSILPKEQWPKQGDKKLSTYVKDQAKLRDPVFEYLVAWNYKRGVGRKKKENRAFIYCSRAARRQLPEAFQLLAWMYSHGYGASKNYLMTFACYYYGAKAGLPVAQYSLGNLYNDAIKNPDAKRKSFKFYWLSAKQGYGPAENNLAYLYLNGGYVRPYKKIFKYFVKASNQGIALASFNLAHLYSYGIGTCVDYEQAKKYFELSAEQGHKLAQRYLEFL